jgi:hypothetical protein
LWWRCWRLGAAGLAVASLRRETSSTATLDARAGEYLTGAFALVAVAFVILLSKFALNQ